MRHLAVAVAVLAVVSWAGIGHAAGSEASPPARAGGAPAKNTAPAGAAAAAPTLGPHAPLLEGTWEFRSLRRPGAGTLVPPLATGVLVIDKGAVLAASYLQASPTRKVGNAWEGRMVLAAERFDVLPEKGYAYDSEAEPTVRPSVPPTSSGRIERVPDGLRFVRADGGTITYEASGRRVQRDPDGTEIIHERTSLVPRIPDNLPGRQP